MYHKTVNAIRMSLRVLLRGRSFLVVGGGRLKFQDLKKNVIAPQYRWKEIYGPPIWRCPITWPPFVDHFCLVPPRTEWISVYGPPLQKIQKSCKFNFGIFSKNIGFWQKCWKETHINVHVTVNFSQKYYMLFLAISEIWPPAEKRR